jgi:Asp-tRNA(Asn)/Glu-tRNA(Gln) amidotransferase B subunit
MIIKTEYFVSKDGREFLCSAYSNIEEPSRGKLPLPKDGYPYRYRTETEFYYHPSCISWNEWEQTVPRLINIDKEDYYRTVFHNFVVCEHFELRDIMAVMKESLKKDLIFNSLFNFVENDMKSYCNKNGKKIYEYPVLFDDIAFCFLMVEFEKSVGKKVIPLSLTLSEAKKVLEELCKDPYENPVKIIERFGFNKFVEEDEVETIVLEVLASNPAKVEEYKKGKTGIASMFIGDVMKKKKGLDPKVVKEMILEKLEL